MRKKRLEDQLDFEADVVFSGPIQLRREVRGSSKRKRSTARDKTTTSRSKTGRPGGMYQRANKRTNW